MKLKYLVWPLIMLAVIVLATKRNVQTVVITTAKDLQNRIVQVIPQPKVNYTVSTKDNDTGLQTLTSGDLSRVYYYHFKKQTSAEVKKLFLQAVTEYNQTGLVKLVPGIANKHQNGITFGVYNKAERSATNNPQASMIELGIGGPTMIQYSGRENYTINHASAKLNSHYADAYKLSVAVHELGHALGLNHNTNRRSVMYPVDQGINQLSQTDLKNLAKIYPRTK
ncbi:matrixin family metalloprotease [Lentilactobacillus senioris]|uniref:matrixin family metalloprotease n=1 Tax=Lentilactobacillus senioris TaxID=931534 RepID=UPI00227E8BDE|nr:matrixin family metalloprotease [Lentilactobacillus senioris]MCY9806159.1 matrixin family metalloprotease [Lentilactobacillus senioris]